MRARASDRTRTSRMARLTAGVALLGESGRIALCALWANKLRTSLTLLGIVIGVGTVVAMASVLSGLDRSMAESISRLRNSALRSFQITANIARIKSLTIPRPLPDQGQEIIKRMIRIV